MGIALVVRRSRGMQLVALASLLCGAAMAAASCGSFSGADSKPADPDASPTTDAQAADASSDLDAGTPGTPLDSGADAGPWPSSLPECAAQRTVHLVGGIGGLAWFTLSWPVPDMIDTFTSTDAYDDPAKVARVLDAAAPHPLYARFVDAGTVVPLWAATGTRPMPTVFVAGSNLTHYAAPKMTEVGGLDVIGAGAAIQAAFLHPPQTVFEFGTDAIYNEGTAYPTASVVTDVSAAITQLQTLGMPAAQAQALAPDHSVVLAWLGGAAPSPDLDTLANRLVFAFNAFRAGAVGTFVMPALENDPHGAFGDLPSLTRNADALASVLHHFYAALASVNEPSCSHNGFTLPLADNVVLVVSGDTPKASYNASGWPDGTPGGANWLYVRSNGYLQPGWFGKVTSAGVTRFDPTTGALGSSGTAVIDLAAADLGVLYAIARGNTAPVTAVSAAAYQGSVANPKP